MLTGTKLCEFLEWRPVIRVVHRVAGDSALTAITVARTVNLINFNNRTLLGDIPFGTSPFQRT
jgi:hypothetical protein